MIISEADEESLAFDVPDEVLERAARRSLWSIALTTGIPAIGHRSERRLSALTPAKYSPQSAAPHRDKWVRRNVRYSPKSRHQPGHAGMSALCQKRPSNRFGN